MTEQILILRELKLIEIFTTLEEKFKFFTQILDMFMTAHNCLTVMYYLLCFKLRETGF